MAATTFRADARAALVAILEAQATASPTLLRKVEASRPGSFPELPCAYVSNLTETITWSAGVRTRLIDGAEVTIVDTYREAVHDGLDQLVDLLVDRLNDATQQVGNAIIELSRVADAEVEVQGTERTTYYRAVVLTLGRTAKWEGRS
jgi:hypothetical protein